MRIEQHQLFHARGGDRLGQLGPEPDHGFGFQRQRAGKTRVLGAETNRLRGQKKHGQISLQMRQRGSHYAVNQRRIDIERQVRPMLLDGRHGQHGNAAGQIKPGEVGGFQVGPKARQGRKCSGCDVHGCIVSAPPRQPA